MDLRKLAAAAAVSVVIGGCASETPEEAAPTEAAETEAPSEATVQATDSEHGTILANADGETLYVFANDEDGESSCYDTCAQNWPALVAEGEPTAGEGVTGTLGTTERRDGTLQVTIADRPLYNFSGDSAPGDTNGQGVGGVWFVAAPDGSPVEE